MDTELSLDLIDRNGEPIEFPAREVPLTILYFMRTAYCPACIKHVEVLIHEAATFRDAGAAIIVAIPDGVDEASRLYTALCPPFPFATTPTGHAAAGLQRRLFGKLLQSGTFLLNDTGLVVYANRATLPHLSLKMDLLREAVAAH